MKEWFLRREPRERLILAIGAAAAVVIIGWRLVWSPLAAGVERLDSRVETRGQLLVDAHSAAAIEPDAASRPRAEQSLLVLVDSTARNHGVAQALTRRNPNGANEIDVTVQAAPFDALIGWLATLEGEHIVSVESASIRATQEPGVVSGRVVLRR
jgi:type II secretory pathway component PulM